MNDIADPTSRFFEELVRRGHEPLLGRVMGTVRFDLVHDGRTDSWLVTIDKGEVTVSRRNARADSVVRTERSFFADLATGRANAMAALLRGAIEVEGDRHPLAQFQRMFPGPRAAEAV